ncbi:hypothetical protein F0562_030753 [Nyssa sinensis]|uniref:Uncharacterized protein n=1 Tax=Nyssa sinensis TaxID=561372 RepID=A0A5J5AX98_9ASTE|nr:hypothetical protein F0562_030753 [Nyssa sinensis]
MVATTTLESSAPASTALPRGGWDDRHGMAPEAVDRRVTKIKRKKGRDDGTIAASTNSMFSRIYHRSVCRKIRICHHSDCESASGRGIKGVVRCSCAVAACVAAWWLRQNNSSAALRRQRRFWDYDRPDTDVDMRSGDVVVLENDEGFEGNSGDELDDDSER